VVVLNSQWKLGPFVTRSKLRLKKISMHNKQAKSKKEIIQAYLETSTTSGRTGTKGVRLRKKESDKKERTEPQTWMVQCRERVFTNEKQIDK
jgi:hypothetical protein